MYAIAMNISFQNLTWTSSLFCIKIQFYLSIKKKYSNNTIQYKYKTFNKIKQNLQNIKRSLGLVYILYLCVSRKKSHEYVAYWPYAHNILCLVIIYKTW